MNILYILYKYREQGVFDQDIFFVWHINELDQWGIQESEETFELKSHPHYTQIPIYLFAAFLLKKKKKTSMLIEDWYNLWKQKVNFCDNCLLMSPFFPFLIPRKYAQVFKGTLFIPTVT